MSTEFQDLADHGTLRITDEVAAVRSGATGRAMLPAVADGADVATLGDTQVVPVAEAGSRTAAKKTTLQKLKEYILSGLSDIGVDTQARQNISNLQIITRDLESNVVSGAWSQATDAYLMITSTVPTDNSGTWTVGKLDRSAAWRDSPKLFARLGEGVSKTNYRVVIISTSNRRYTLPPTQWNALDITDSTYDYYQVYWEYGNSGPASLTSEDASIVIEKYSETHTETTYTGNVPLTSLEADGASKDQYMKYDGAEWSPSALPATNYPITKLGTYGLSTGSGVVGPNLNDLTDLFYICVSYTKNGNIVYDYKPVTKNFLTSNYKSLSIDNVNVMPIKVVDTDGVKGLQFKTLQLTGISLVNVDIYVTR